jgi:hypothetical protein
MPSPSCDPDPKHQGTAVPAADRDTFTHTIAKIRRSLDMRVSLSPEQFQELLLSHHPDHPSFDNDIIRIRGRRICAGCLLAYPTALLVLVLFHPAEIGSVLLAILFAALSQFRRFTKNVRVQHGFRILAGIALGLGIGGGLWAVEQGRWAAVLVLIAGAIAYAGVKAWSVYTRLELCGQT